MKKKIYFSVNDAKNLFRKALPKRRSAADLIAADPEPSGRPSTSAQPSGSSANVQPSGSSTAPADRSSSTTNPLQGNAPRPADTNLDDLLPAPDVFRNLDYSASLLAELEDPNRRARVSTKLKRMREIRPEEVAEVERAAQDHDFHVEQRINPHSAVNMKHVLTCWYDYIMSTYKANPVPLEGQWHETILKLNFKNFLRWKVVNSEGLGLQGEGKYICARTLRCFAGIFVNLIIIRCRNDKAASCGLELLRSGLYDDIKNRVEELVLTFDLKRGTTRERRFCSLPELRMLINEAMAISTLVGRQARIQLITIVMLGTFFLLRPGSMAPSCKQYVQEKKYPKLGDIEEIQLLGPCKWQIIFNVSNHKGYNASMAKETFITLLSVTKNHNAIFDPCIWMLLHLLHQGALKDIDTVEDLIAYQGAQIYIKDEMKHMPLFCAVVNGANALKVGEPLTVKGLVRAVSALGISAGFENLSIYDFRRGGAEEIRAVLGDEVASLALGHYNRIVGTMLRYYSSGLRNIDLIRTRLGETTADGRNADEVQARINRNVRTRAAVVAMVGLGEFKNMTQGGVVYAETKSKTKSSTKTVRTQEAEDKIQASEQIMGVNAVLSVQWAALKDLFDMSACDDQSLPADDDPPNGIFLNSLLTRAGIDIIDQDEFDGRAEEYRTLLRAKSSVLRPARRRENALEKRKVFKAAKNNTKDTYQERNALADTIINPHLHPDALTLDALREGGPPPPPQQANDDDASEGDDEEEHAIPNITTEEFERTCRPQAVHIQLKSAGLTAQAKDDGDEDEDAPRGEIVDFFRSFDMAEVDKSAAFYNIEITNDDRAKLEVFLKEMHDHLEASGAFKELGEFEGVEGPDEEKEEEKLPDVDLTYLVSSLLRFISKPISEERDITAFCKTQNALKCHLCARMPNGDSHSFTARENLNKHIRTIHSAWYDLVIDMLTDDPDVFACPSCGFEASSEEEVRTHCLSPDCEEQEYYKTIFADAQRRRQLNAETQKRPKKTSVADNINKADLETFCKLDMEEVERLAEHYEIRLQPALRKKFAMFVESLHDLQGNSDDEDGEVDGFDEEEFNALVRLDMKEVERMSVKYNVPLTVEERRQFAMFIEKLHQLRSQ